MWGVEHDEDEKTMELTPLRKIECKMMVFGLKCASEHMLMASGQNFVKRFDLRKPAQTISAGGNMVINSYHPIRAFDYLREKKWIVINGKNDVRKGGEILVHDATEIMSTETTTPSLTTKHKNPPMILKITFDEYGMLMSSRFFIRKKDGGVSVVVTPRGAYFRPGEDEEIPEKIVETPLLLLDLDDGEKKSAEDVKCFCFFFEALCAIRAYINIGGDLYGEEIPWA